MWEKDININDIREIRTRTCVYFGCGAINKIQDIAKDFKSKGLDKVIVMSGRNAYKATGAWTVVEKALIDNSIEYINYDGVTPNPTTTAVNEAAKMIREGEIEVPKTKDGLILFLEEMDCDFGNLGY